jgi:hypothetical protein
MTWLSSSGLAKLYGFGDVFDLQVIIKYWQMLFVNPAIIAVIILVVISLMFNLRDLSQRPKIQGQYLVSHTSWILLAVWFFIPFAIATFGVIKDPRYIYPGLIPIFIISGLAAAQISEGKSGFISTCMICMIAFPGYLYGNDFIKIQTFKSILTDLKMDANFVTSSPPDPRDWKIDKLVQRIGQQLDASKTEKKVVLLGGNRYYHLRLLDYEGLNAGFHLNYVVLPYYSRSDMSVDESLDYSEKVAPAGIVFKSGENWPLFSSKLDSKIIEKLKLKSEYSLVDLEIEQPDKSNFYIFIKKDLIYVPVESSSAISGSWKVGSGTAEIFVDAKGLLTVITETGVKGTASITDGKVLVHEWGVSGRLTADMKFIHWNNGSVWIR